MATLLHETWPGSAGSAWPAGWSVFGTGTVSGDNQGLLVTNTGAYSNGRGTLSTVSGTNSSAVVDFALDSVQETFVYLGVRTGSVGSPAPDTGYDAELYTRTWDDHHVLTLHRNKVAISGSVPLPFRPQAGVPYRLRLEAFNDDGVAHVRARVWRADELEPTTWLVEADDPSPLASGRLGWLGASTGADGAARTVTFSRLIVTSTAQSGVVRADPPSPPPMHVWSAFARDTDYAPTTVLPIRSIKGVLRHLGVSRVVLETESTPQRLEALQPSRGVTLYRDGVQRFTGLVETVEDEWDAENGVKVIRAECVGDEQHLADRLVFPDPGRAPDDQTVSDYWTFAGLASSAMWTLISQQAGAGAVANGPVSGLVMGDDPGAGLSRTWTGRYADAGDGGVLDKLAQISVASGENLGVRFTATSGSLTVDIVQPRDLTAGIVFSADLRNLLGYKYRQSAPTVTDALALGQGDLKLRTAKHVSTASALALAYARRIWRLVDRRDTADTAELTKAASDEVAQGDATVSLQVTLTDSQAATWMRDWDLGDAVTVRVGHPGQPKVAAVSDVVREIGFEVDDKGREQVHPAIGTYDAKATLPGPSLTKLTEVGARLASYLSHQ